MPVIGGIYYDLCGYCRLLLVNSFFYFIYQMIAFKNAFVVVLLYSFGLILSFTQSIPIRALKTVLMLQQAVHKCGNATL